MAEMVIPGTYITVRAEGLISAGRVSSGIVGVVGTAASGTVGEAVTLANFANAREVFGAVDPFNRPEDGAHPLTLVRALEHIFNNGATSVIAVRVADSDAANATFAVQDESGNTVAVLTAATPGTWANNMRIQVDPAEEDCRVLGEVHTSDFSRLRYGSVVMSPENQFRVYRAVSRTMRTLNAVYKRVVRNEQVAPNASGRYFLSNVPVENVASLNEVRVLDSAGAVVRTYGDGDILYGAPGGPAPGADEIRIDPQTGEIIFEASQVPDSGQVVRATYGVGHAAPQPGEILVTTWSGEVAFATAEAPVEANGDRLEASYLVDQAACVRVTLRASGVIERYTVPDGRLLAALIARSAASGRPSALVTAEAHATHGANAPRTGVDAYFGTGSNTPGNNGAGAGRDEYTAGLETLSNRLINIVVLAGQDARSMGSVLLGHLNATAETDFERIGVIGAAGSSVADFLGHEVSSDRVVLVAPGLAYRDGQTLPPAYAAAAIAGMIASLPVQTSLTNKVVNIPGLTLRANRGEQEQLIRRNIVAIISKEGFRVLKSITTAGEGTPFSAITTRRIVDYAKYGVRSAANPYIGRLNNVRVRAALKGTLDAFLTRMVEDEALTGYELEVSATRAQEIAGEVSVVMTLQPTFSIDYIRVVMNLK